MFNAYYSKVTQSCLTLCNPMDCSPPGCSVHGIFQARILEWVAISFSRRSSQPRDWTRVSRIVGRMLYHLSHQGSPNIYYRVLANSHGGGGLVSKSCPTLAIPWTVACQAPLSIGFSRQEYWSGVPFPSPGDLPNPGIEPRSPALQVDDLPTELWGKQILIEPF